MAGKGRRFEHEVANGVTRDNEGVVAWPVGYSGNNAVPCPDVVVLSSSRGTALELKKTRQDTFGIPRSDLQQLLEVQTNYLDVALLIDFANREPLYVEPKFPSLSEFGLDDVDPIENFHLSIPDCFDPRRTDGGEEPTLRLSKPSTDEWSSARSGLDAVEKIADETVGV